MLAKFTVKAAVLDPVTAGPFEITLITYPVPVGVLAGIVAEIVVPLLASLTSVPMFTGETKLPEAFDNCAVYVLLVKVPELVKGTETVAPVEAVTQNGLPTIGVVVVMVFEDIGTPLIIKSSNLNVAVALPVAVILIRIDVLLS